MALRTLSSGVSGLQANQAALDVIGNNIANVNTPGFKASRTVFADLLHQTVAGAQAPGTSTGGTNAIQFGLGATLAAVQPIFTQGAVRSTDNPTDLAIQGQGFFVLANGAESFYTRAGAFGLDAGGTLVDLVTGFRIQGASGDIVLPSGATTPASATTSAFFGGNLDASRPDGTAYTLTFSVIDSLGASHPLTMTFTKNFAATAGQWDWAITSSDPGIGSFAGDTGSVTFDSSGLVSSGASATLDITYAGGAAAASPQSVTLELGAGTGSAGLTGFAGASTAALARQDGFTAGTLTAFTISPDGSLVGAYDNGRTAVLGQIHIATFANPGGLERAGDNLWRESVNSGVPTLGAPGTGGRGTLLPGAIEGSNVDLAREFTELITTQRGFEASARIIRVADEIMQTVVNIKQ